MAAPLGRGLRRACLIPSQSGKRHGRLRLLPPAGLSRVIVRGLIRILGIDPGLRRTGWGVVALDGNRLSFLACGSLTTDDKAELATRLLAIHDGLRHVVEEHT